MKSLWLHAKSQAGGDAVERNVSRCPELFCATRGIESHESERDRDREQNDGRDNFHAYSSSRVLMSHSMRR
jgi:hypothetical protein